MYSQPEPTGAVGLIAGEAGVKKPNVSRCALIVAGFLILLPRMVVAQGPERLYQDACDGGDMIACNVFGLMYEYGDGVPQDLARATSLYQRTCEGGLLVGCTNLGLMYEAGVGVTQDLARARGLYQVACEGGELLACESRSAVEQAANAEPGERFFKSGRVADTRTGDALGAAVVEVPALGILVISDAAGRFDLDGLPAGRYALRAERLGYEALQGELEVPGNPEFLVLLERAVVGDLRETGSVVGRVTELGERALSDVEVTVLGQQRASTLSNRQGRFTLRDIEPGLVEVRFVHLGYAPRTATLIVQPGRTVEIAPTMVTQPIELEPIQVTVRSSFLEQNGFYERSEGMVGTHFTAREIEILSPNGVSEVIRGRVPGVRIQYGSYGASPADGSPTTGPVSGTMARAVSRGQRGGRDCVLAVYVDGRLETFDPDLDLIPPEQLAAVEVYIGIDTPVQYGVNSCGVILLWTRRGG